MLQVATARKCWSLELGSRSESTSYVPSTRFFSHALPHKSRGITVLKSGPFSICFCPRDKLHLLLLYPLSLSAFSVYYPNPVILNYWVFPNLPGFLILRAYVYTILSFWNSSLVNSYSFFDTRPTHHLLREAEPDSLPTTSPPTSFLELYADCYHTFLILNSRLCCALSVFLQPSPLRLNAADYKLLTLPRAFFPWPVDHGWS